MGWGEKVNFTISTLPIREPWLMNAGLSSASPGDQSISQEEEQVRRLSGSQGGQIAPLGERKCLNKGSVLGSHNQQSQGSYTVLK